MINLPLEETLEDEGGMGKGVEVDELRFCVDCVC